MKVRWTDNAVAHLVNIYEYIAVNSPTYAKQMVDKITHRSVQIAAHPLSGRKVPEYDSEAVRELIEQPYRIKEYSVPQIKMLINEIENGIGKKISIGEWERL